MQGCQVISSLFARKIKQLDNIGIVASGILSGFRWDLNSGFDKAGLPQGRATKFE